MAKKTIYKKFIDWLDAGIDAAKAVEEGKIRNFRNASTLEGVIVDKHFTPYQPSQGFFGTSSSEECMLGVELNNGSKEVFHYYGNRAEEIYLFNQKGDKVSFKEGYKLFDTEEDIK